MLPKAFELPNSLKFIGVPRDYGKAYGNVVWGMVPLQKVWIPAALSQLPDEYFEVDCLDEPIDVPVRGYVSFPDPDRALLRFEVDSEADYLLTRLNGQLSAIQAAICRQIRRQVLNDTVYTGPQYGVATISLAPYKLPFLATAAWVAIIVGNNLPYGYTVTVLDKIPKPPSFHESIELHSLFYQLSRFEPPKLIGAKN